MTFMADIVFGKSEYVERQEVLMAELPSSSVLIIPNNIHSVRSNDTKYPYRANSYLMYLSGWEESDSLLVISNVSGTSKSTLFVKPRDIKSEIWEGRIIGVEGAIENWPIDHARPTSEFEEFLNENLELCSNLFLISEIDQQIDDMVRKKWKGEILDPRSFIDPMRSIKSQSEIELMKRAATIASEAHVIAMSVSKPDIGEWELQSVIESHFTMNRSTNSYNPIVGGGDNATILHYNSNSKLIEEGKLVLIDAGCEVHGYASDITRTWPVSGKFSQSQREIYELVLKAELAAIDACQVGSPWDSMHHAASRILAAGLIELGILDCSMEDALGKKFDGEYRKFFMHGTGHMLGLDVHDVGGGRQGGEPGPVLKSGMVVTIEPGLYFSSWREDISVPKKYSGIGVRIEDDILITEDGPVVLTDGCPKTIDEIESIVGSAL